MASINHFCVFARPWCILYSTLIVIHSSRCREMRYQTTRMRLSGTSAGGTRGTWSSSTSTPPGPSSSASSSPLLQVRMMTWSYWTILISNPFPCVTVFLQSAYFDGLELYKNGIVGRHFFKFTYIRYIPIYHRHFHRHRHHRHHDFILFPGIMAGSNRSGDLADPQVLLW